MQSTRTAEVSSAVKSLADSAPGSSTSLSLSFNSGKFLPSFCLMHVTVTRSFSLVTRISVSHAAGNETEPRGPLFTLPVW